MALAEERQQMMLAQAIELNVLYNDHFIVGDAEHRTIENCFGVLPVPARQVLERFRETLRRFFESLAGGIFADLLEDFPREIGEADTRGVLNRLHFGRAHCPLSLPGVAAGTYSSSHSKLFLDVSSTRTRSSRAAGKDLSRR